MHACMCAWVHAGMRVCVGTYLHAHRCPDRVIDSACCSAKAAEPTEAAAERRVALQALTDLVGLPEFDAALGLGGEGVSSWLGVCEGEDLEILIRSRDGWTCCRRRPAAGAEGLRVSQGRARPSPTRRTNLNRISSDHTRRPKSWIAAALAAAPLRAPVAT